jgi:hypothetical protein
MKEPKFTALTMRRNKSGTISAYSTAACPSLPRLREGTAEDFWAVVN